MYAWQRRRPMKFEFYRCCYREIKVKRIDKFTNLQVIRSHEQRGDDWMWCEIERSTIQIWYFPRIVHKCKPARFPFHVTSYNWTKYVWCACACGPKSIHTILNSFELNSTLMFHVNFKIMLSMRWPRMIYFNRITYYYLFVLCVTFRHVDHWIEFYAKAKTSFSTFSVDSYVKILQNYNNKKL